MNTGTGMGAFFIVLLVIVVALGAGFLFSENDNQYTQNQIANAGLEQAVTKLATAEADQKLKQETLDKQNKELESAQATIVANQTELDALRNANRSQADNIASLQGEVTKLTRERDTQSLQVASLQAQVSNLQAEMNTAQLARQAAENRANEAEKALISTKQKEEFAMVQVTELKNQNKDLNERLTKAEQERDEYRAQLGPDKNPLSTLPYMIAGGAVVLGLTVFASYKAFKMDHKPERIPHAAQGDETIYVKMSREEARQYARDRARVYSPEQAAMHENRRDPQTLNEHTKDGKNDGDWFKGNRETTGKNARV